MVLVLVPLPLGTEAAKLGVLSADSVATSLNVLIQMIEVGLEDRNAAGSVRQVLGGGDELGASVAELRLYGRESGLGDGELALSVGESLRMHWRGLG